MQIGYYHSGDPLQTVNRIARAERAGFDTAWVGDHYAIWFPEEIYPETFSELGAAAMVTKKIRLGSGVTDPFRRSPALIAQSSATLDFLSRGRAILGIGGGEPMNITPFGVEYNYPAGRLKETVHMIRSLWGSTLEKPVSYSGKFGKLKSAFIQVNPVSRNKTIPIYIAGTSATTRRIAGELGDGWYAHVHSAETFAEDLGEVFSGAKAAGKLKNDIDTVAWFLCAVDKDPDVAREAVYLPAAMELILAYDKLERLGYSKDIPNELALKRILMDKQQIDKLVENAKKVPIKAIEETAAFGNPDQCISTFEKFAKAGAKHIVVLLLGQNLDESFDLFERYIIPHVHSL